jgi:tRNA dimethylallyltransferase
MNKIKTISILGPTASGKTGLAIELAKRLNGEIISCDSMQLYKEMNIGTATPDMEERAGITHHLMDVVEPEVDFSAVEYARLASEAIADVASRGKLPILCGGTGMYHDSLMKISSFSEGEADEALREELYKYARDNGNEALHAMLREIDPEAADAIHHNNVKRVIRAIEIYKTTGKTKTETDREQISGEIPYYNTTFILDFADRDLLYSRIEKRVDIMMDIGLLEEVKSIIDMGIGKDTTAMQAIGYKEIVQYLDGEITLEEAVDKIKQGSRRYAKRQLTWYRRNEKVNWVKSIDEVFSILNN